MAKEIITSDPIKFYARAAFVRLDKPKSFDGSGNPRWETTFLLDPADKRGLEGLSAVIAAAADISKRAYEGLVPLELRKIAAIFIPGQASPDPKTKADGVEVAFIDGDTKEYNGYAGMFVIPAHQDSTKIKPAIANRLGKDVSPGEPEFPYSGCYVRGKITLWAQDNKYGRRIGVNLRGVQFVAEGEAFTQGELSAEDEFEALEDQPAAASGGVGF